MTDTPTGTAQAAASTAADEGKHVAGVAQGEAAKVASEATAQARSLAGEARTQVTDQAVDQTRVQRDKLVGTLGTLGDDLDQMADRSDGGLAADVAREVAAHAKSLTSYLDGREPGDLLGDVRDFARRRPGLFLLGALTAGVVAGRLARGVKDADDAPTSAPVGTTQPPIQPPVQPPVQPPATAPTFGTAPAAPPAYATPTHGTPAYDAPAPITPAVTSEPGFAAPTGDPLSDLPAR